MTNVKTPSPSLHAGARAVTSAYSLSSLIDYGNDRAAEAVADERASLVAGRAAGVQGEAVAEVKRLADELSMADGARSIPTGEFYRNITHSQYVAKRQELHAAINRLAAASQAETLAKPEGFVLVPREPTEAMQHAAEEAYRAWVAADVPWSAFEHSDSYRAMLAAAPTPTASIAPKAEAATGEDLAIYQSIADNYSHAAPVAQAAAGADTAYPWQVLEMAKRVIEAHRSGSDGELSEAVKYLEVAALKATAQSSAAREVLAERQRQISAEGWNPAHDDEHDDGSLAQAAACYALHTEPVGNVGDYLRFWPWDSDAWKPKGRRRNLIRAGALIIAEIERLDRATPRPEATAVAPVAGKVKS